MSWYVRNLISDRFRIRSLVIKSDVDAEQLEFSDDTVEVSVGQESKYDYMLPVQEAYDDLLSVEIKIKELFTAGKITGQEMEIINRVSMGYTFSEIEKDVEIEREGVTLIFRKTCNKIAFALGGEFTDDGYVHYLAEKYNLGDEQINKAISYMKENTRN